jgi:hypothetical protein
MDQEKKQKVMLGAVAVAILGAGGFWWFTSGSGRSGGEEQNTGPVVRVQRDDAGEVARAPVRAERTEVTRSDSGRTVERAERREAAQPTVRRATRGRTDTRREKEKEVLPAS